MFPVKHKLSTYDCCGAQVKRGGLFTEYPTEGDCSPLPPEVTLPWLPPNKARWKKPSRGHIDVEVVDFPPVAAWRRIAARAHALVRIAQCVGGEGVAEVVEKGG